MNYLHTMLRVTDLEQSLRFFRDQLGLEAETDSETAGRKPAPRRRQRAAGRAKPGSGAKPTGRAPR